jgi:phage repressor protein C with HTH and peptisase S24 domain
MNKYERLLNDLKTSKIGKMKVFGNSLTPKVKSGSILTFEPKSDYKVGDIVFSKVRGRYIDAHQITKVDAEGRYLISNNKGHDNGWTRSVFGKVTKIEPPRKS